MLKHLIMLPTVAFTLLFTAGCGSAPIHGAFLSNEKNIWVEDVNGNGMHYCMSSVDGSKIEPTCYVAKKGVIAKPAASGSSTSSSTSTPAARLVNDAAKADAPPTAGDFHN